jgi:hypothetical protein
VSLTTSSDKTTIGLYFIFTCVTTYTLILFNKDSTPICFISGSNTDGTCVLDGGYITDYTYTCNTTTNVSTCMVNVCYIDLIISIGIKHILETIF